ncbi:MAG: hypothetical protein Q9226_002732 [Calogaya cf. arnoldii]
MYAKRVKPGEVTVVNIPPRRPSTRPAAAAVANATFPPAFTNPRHPPLPPAAAADATFPPAPTRQPPSPPPPAAPRIKKEIVYKKDYVRCWGDHLIINGAKTESPIYIVHFCWSGETPKSNHRVYPTLASATDFVANGLRASPGNPKRFLVKPDLWSIRPHTRCCMVTQHPLNQEARLGLDLGGVGPPQKRQAKTATKEQLSEETG